MQLLKNNEKTIAGHALPKGRLAWWFCQTSYGFEVAVEKMTTKNWEHGHTDSYSALSEEVH